MSKKFNPYNYPICFSPPLRIAPHYWAGHVPFAMFLVEILRPKVFVELGTYYGVSYCAFCQAVKELELDTRCYAVDTWQGDGITWSYEVSEVLDDLKTHHDPLYGKFSRLMQTTFDNALQGFSDGEIDLLHIDGYHPYESVKHDFETWLPKMSERGVILFHDINVRQADYGVWKLWEEITPNYPHFEFWHEHGLGVLAVGRKPPKVFREFLLEQDATSVKEIQDFFFKMGETWKPFFEVVEIGKEKKRLQVENENLKAENRKQKDDLGQVQVQLEQVQVQLHSIRNSMAYRIGNRFSTALNTLSPQGSWSRELLQKVKKLLFSRQRLN